VPGHWPDFTSKEEVDDWISDMNIILNFFEKAKKIDEKTD
jgi:Asp-tRNA(Asn)/Glu-tRNA(Gln) amidotransferase C subunit